MPQLPPPPSRRRTLARMKKLDVLEEALLTDSRLGEITPQTPTFSEREICLQVQNVLDEYVKKTFKPRVVREITWGQTCGARPMPCVEVGGHSFYPDHIVLHNDFSVAIEVKRYTGQSSVLQQVVGQSTIYSQRYGFVIAFIADVTQAGHLARRIHADPLLENDLTIQSELWWYHNTFIVCRHVKERFTAL